MSPTSFSLPWNWNEGSLVQGTVAGWTIIPHHQIVPRDTSGIPQEIWSDKSSCVCVRIIASAFEDNGKLTVRTIDSIRRILNYLDVVPVTIEKRELHISSESREASDVLKSLGLPYPRIRECAHTQFSTMLGKHGKIGVQHLILIMIIMRNPSSRKISVVRYINGVKIYHKQ